MPNSKFPNIDDLINQVMITSDVVWKNNITREKLDNWLNNFNGEVFKVKYERELALWLLVNFVFYNEKEVKHLCATLYRDFIHNNLNNENCDYSIEEKLDKIHDRIRFHYLGRSGESGAFLLYYFRKENLLSVRDFISNLDNIPQTVDEIIYVDDVTLSANAESQAYCYLQSDLEKLSGKKITILTLIASRTAINFLKENGIDIINCITLEDQDRCFSDDSNIFINHKDHLENCKKIAQHYGAKIYKDPLGYNNCQYTFGFFYNTPDNSLPIFWSKNNGWIPIIERYDKNYGRTRFKSLGKYL